MFVILTGYCHIGSQQGVSTHVHARRLNRDGGVGGVGPSRTKMQSNRGLGNGIITIAKKKKKKKMKNSMIHVMTFLASSC
jgi:hypothetical protein